VHCQPAHGARLARRRAGAGRVAADECRDIEANFFATIGLAPKFAERVRAAKRESKFIGLAELPGYFRKPFGPGWALLGDAATTRTRSPRWASMMHSATPSCW
jgi:hypothetical protein